MIIQSKTKELHTEKKTRMTINEIRKKLQMLKIRLLIKYIKLQLKKNFKNFPSKSMKLSYIQNKKFDNIQIMATCMKNILNILES